MINCTGGLKSNPGEVAFQVIEKTRLSKIFKGFRFDLSDSFPRNPELVSNFRKSFRFAPVETVSELDDFSLSVGEFGKP